MDKALRARSRETQHDRPAGDARRASLFCKCGRAIVYQHETRCEDCWVEDQVRFGGVSRRARIK